MILKSLNKYRYLLFFFLWASVVYSDEPVDIWKKEKIQKSISENELNKEKNFENENNNLVLKDTNSNLKIKILEEASNKVDIKKVYGLFDPGTNNFSLNMWVKTPGENIKKIFERIDKLELSGSAETLFTNTILTYSFPPAINITEEEFLELKINWLIKNKRDNLLEDFLNKNENFKGKKKVIQYLVDKNIAAADLNEGCKKSGFISKDIKDAYLEKFKIYCLIFNDKKNEAQLVFDILKDEGLSDKFFNSKINYLLGIINEPDKIVKDNNLLNFYLSSVTVPDFNYEPGAKTDKFIWEYLNAANLITINDIEDKEKIINLEKAANENTFNKEKIFDIYKKLPFDINSLINAEGIYQSLDGLESRALIYQKYLLSDNSENKIKLLILLKDLFKKDNLSNIYTKFMSERLKEIEKKSIPEKYLETVERNIISEEEYKLGKIKYDDKILHRSRVVRFYAEKETPKQKTQKDLENVYKKIKRNKNYFFSAKDLALVQSLEADGINIPKEIKTKEMEAKYSIPEGMLKLLQNGEVGMLSLKFVEIIGEDEIYDLDAETIYFMIHILNKAKIINFRNKVLSAALPLRS